MGPGLGECWVGGVDGFDGGVGDESARCGGWHGRRWRWRSRRRGRCRRCRRWVEVVRERGRRERGRRERGRRCRRRCRRERRVVGVEGAVRLDEVQHRDGCGVGGGRERGRRRGPCGGRGEVAEPDPRQGTGRAPHLGHEEGDRGGAVPIAEGVSGAGCHGNRVERPTRVPGRAGGHHHAGEAAGATSRGRMAERPGVGSPPVLAPPQRPRAARVDDLDSAVRHELGTGTHGRRRRNGQSDQRHENSCRHHLPTPSSRHPPRPPLSGGTSAVLPLDENGTGRRFSGRGYRGREDGQQFGAASGEPFGRSAVGEGAEVEPARVHGEPGVDGRERRRHPIVHQDVRL